MDLRDLHSLTTTIKSSLTVCKRGNCHAYATERIGFLDMALELNNTSTFLLLMNHMVDTGFNLRKCCAQEEKEIEKAELAWKELVSKSSPWF